MPDGLKGSIFEVSLAFTRLYSLNDVQKKHFLTNYCGIDLTIDELRFMIKKSDKIWLRLTFMPKPLMDISYEYFKWP